MSYSNINRVVLIGRLTADPELRALPSGSSVCTLRIASNRARKTDDGEYAEQPNFFNVSVFGTTAETVHRYMSRGRRVAIDGRLSWSEWETPEGARRQAVEIVADSVQFLDGRGDHPQGGGDPAGEDSERIDAGVGSELVGVGSAIDDEVVF